MSDVTPAHGVLVSAAAAREIAAALDHLDRLASPRGQRLSPRLASIKAALARAPATHAEVSAAHFVPQCDSQWEAGVVDTTTAARLLGITPGGVAWLCRNGRLAADRIGGRWLIASAALHVYEQEREER
jgi:hypothetical protein